MLNREYKRDTVKLLTECTETSPSRPRKLQNIIKKAQTQPVTKYTPDEALAFLLQTGMSRDAYITTRLGAKARNADIYPNYGIVHEAKKKCYPDGIEVTNAG